MNAEGYRDPSADRAVGKVQAQSKKEPDPAAARRNQLTMEALRAVANTAGMEIRGRVWLKDLESGWVFK
jgi:hypothetical protein